MYLRKRSYSPLFFHFLFLFLRITVKDILKIRFVLNNVCSLIERDFLFCEKKTNETFSKAE